MDVLEALPAGLIEGAGVVGVVLIFYWLLATGRLVTRREVQNDEAAHVRELDDVKADRDVWRATCLEQKGLMSQLLIGQETTNRLLRAIPHVEDHES